MLTKKQNLLETIKGGKPDRFVNQFEFMNIIMESINLKRHFIKGVSSFKDDWGVTWILKEGQLGKFPIHTDEYKVLKDITDWKKYVIAPQIITSDELWQPAVEHANRVDRNEEFVTSLFLPGIFERIHDLMGMEDTLISFYEEPEAMHELIDYIAQHEIDYTEVIIDKIHPDCILQHDDWGTQISSFISPDMFKEFFLPAYKKVYSYFKSNGVELIVHHSDSYAANLVPFMIEMGIDIWQGAMSNNNIPELIRKYGKQISFMGQLDSANIDFPAWTPEICSKAVEEACISCGKLYFIPCLTQGLHYSSFPGVYETVSKEIDRLSKELF